MGQVLANLDAVMDTAVVHEESKSGRVLVCCQVGEVLDKGIAIDGHGLHVKPSKPPSAETPATTA